MIRDMHVKYMMGHIIFAVHIGSNVRELNHYKALKSPETLKSGEFC